MEVQGSCNWKLPQWVDRLFVKSLFWKVTLVRGRKMEGFSMEGFWNVVQKNGKHTDGWGKQGEGFGWENAEQQFITPSPKKDTNSWHPTMSLAPVLQSTRPYQKAFLLFWCNKVLGAKSGKYQQGGWVKPFILGRGQLLCRKKLLQFGPMYSQSLFNELLTCLQQTRVR